MLSAGCANEIVVRVTDNVLNEESLRRLDTLDASGLLVHLDLARVVAPTAGGLGRLVRLHYKLRRRGRQLVIGNVRPSAYEILVLTRLIDVLDVRPKQEAISHACR